MQAFCPEHIGESIESVSVPDPFILHVPLTSNDSGSLEAASNTRFYTLVSREVVPTITGERSLDESLSFLKVFAVDSSLRVRELLFSKLSSTPIGTERLVEKDTLRVKNPRLVGLQKRTLDTKSGFIVDDWDESAFGNGVVSGLGIGSIAPLAEPRFTLDYTQIYAIATGMLDLLPRESEWSGERNLQGALEELLNSVANPLNSKNSTSQTA